MRRSPILTVLALALASCGGGTEPVEQDLCKIQPLPLSGDAAGPTVTDVGLELQGGVRVVLFATATDPQGTDNLYPVQQSIGVFPDKECRGSPIVLQDDISGSGEEETFGTVLTAADSPALYAAIAAESSWPVDISFSDADGHRTAGRVAARITR